MAKETFYFSHDSNARNDEKIISVRMKYGAEGYGIFFMILERLMESTNYMSIKDYNIIAFDLRVDASIVKSIIENFGLFAFTEDGKCFYSESFNRRMEPLDNLREQRRRAGLKSAEKRAKKADVQTTVERSLPIKPTKESKVKESKVNNISLSTRETKFISDLLIEPMNCLLEDQAWLEPVCMNNHISLIEAKDYIILFFADLQNREDYSKTAREAKDHFAKWLRIQLQEKERQKKGGYDERNNYHRADAEPAAKAPKDYSGGF